MSELDLFTATMERCGIGLSQRRARFRPSEQVGIGDERRPEGDQIGLVICQALLCERQAFPLLAMVLPTARRDGTSSNFARSSGTPAARSIPPAQRLKGELAEAPETAAAKLITYCLSIGQREALALSAVSVEAIAKCPRHLVDIGPSTSGISRTRAPEAILY